MSIITQSLLGGVAWYIATLPFALCLFPILRRILPPSFSWGFSRLAAPYAVAWVNLVPFIFLGQVPFTKTTILLTAVIIGLFGKVVAKHFFGPPAPIEKNSKEIVLFESLFLILILLSTLAIATSSNIGDSERMRDTAFWTTLHAQQKFPLVDPHFSGKPLQYYVLGYFQAAIPSFLVRLPALTTYNLSLAYTFASFLVALFLILRSVGVTLLGSISGTFLIGLSGDWHCTFALLKQVAFRIPYPGHTVADPLYTEFPWIPFMEGFLHPSFFALSFFLVCLGVLFHALKSKSRTLFFLSGVGIGFASLVNVWDVPLLMASAGIGLVSLFWRKELIVEQLGKFLFLLLLGYLFASVPFHALKPANPLVLIRLEQPHRLTDLLGALGLFLVPIHILASTTLCFRQWSLSRAVFCLSIFVLFIDSTRGFTLLLCLILALYAIKHQGDFAKIIIPFCFVALLAIVAAEWVYLRDLNGGLNTPLKLYAPIRSLLGVAAIALFQFHPLPSPKRAIRHAIVGIWLVMSLTYGIRQVRGIQKIHPYVTSLDGLTRVEQEFPNDAALIRKIQSASKDIATNGVILEGPGHSYGMNSHVASATGLIAYAAWSGHAHFEQLYQADNEHSRRIKTIDRIYGSLALDPKIPCIEKVGELNSIAVNYVVIGDYERKRYSAESLAQLAHCLTPVIEAGTSLFMRVPLLKNERLATNELSVDIPHF